MRYLTSALSVLVLAALIFLGATACVGVDAARNAGERASDRGASGDDAPPAPTAAPAAPSDGGDASEPRATEAASEATSTLPEVPGGGGTGGEGLAQETVAEETVTEEVVSEEVVSEPVLDPKWYQDSDGNVVPDFIEVENGYDPLKNDCAPEECPGGSEGLDFYTEERNALLILDSSGSMSADAGDGRTKMQAAKDALLRYAGPSSVLFETGFAVYGHRGDSTEAGKEESCEAAAETLLPIGEVDPATFEATLSEFEPTGWTHIEGALREAEAAFEGREGETNRILLVSDGLETCGGDPVAAAEDLRDSGIEVQIDVVGFGVPDDEAEGLRDVAAASGGKYHDAQTGADLDEFFQKQAEASRKTFDAFACELRNGFHDTICDQNQCNDATVFRIALEELPKHEPGSPEYEAFIELSDRIDAGLKERQKARDEASARAEELRKQWLELQEEHNRALRASYGI